MPHESTVEHEKTAKNYGPIENARRAISLNSSAISQTPCNVDHECDEENSK